MQPIPESHEADDHYGPFLYLDQDLLEYLVVLGGQVREIVPTCMGLSLSLREQGVTFTVVASAPEIALLDAVQYVEDGPRVDALATDAVVAAVDGLTLEQEWALFGAATAASEVASTLSMPIVTDGDAVGGFNLYATRSHAFDGRHEELADVLGAWAQGAVSDADLPFRSRDLARRAPHLLRDLTRLTVAAALLSRARGVSVVAAEDRLRQAAVRAAVPLPTLVDRMIRMLKGADADG